MTSTLPTAAATTAADGEPANPRQFPLDFPATVPALLARVVERYPDHELVVTASGRMTFAAVEQASRNVGKQLLGAGVGKATRVGMLFPQGAEWIVTFLGASRAGALVMPFSTFSTPAELRRSLRHGDVAHLVVPRTMFGRDMPAFLEEAVPELAGGAPGAFVRGLPYLRTVHVYGGADRSWAATVDPDEADSGVPGVDDELLAAAEAEIAPADLLIMISTSGTTSDPKGVVHTHGTQVRHGANLAELRRIDHSARVFAAMPFFWVGGFTCALVPALYSGATLLCQERFDAASALDLIERERPTMLSGWPNVRERLVNHPSYPERDLGGISFLPPPGGPPVDLQRFHNSLGMTETSGPHCAASADEAVVPLPDGQRGSFGPKVPYVEHRIADPVTSATLEDGQEGEVCIRGYSVMAGLYKREREDTFDADGWYHTGDRGTFRDGLLYFTGRASEMIKTAGANVSPREVEVALEACPGVKLALVFGLDDAERGQVVVAGVVAEPGVVVDPDALRVELRRELAGYKVPRTLVVLEDAEVPLLASGKANRRAVAATLAGRIA